MKAFQYIILKQQLWAKMNNIELVGSQLDRGEKNYTREFTDNFHEPVSAKTLEELGKGDGNELGNGIIPGKIQALHSSSALGVNVFDYWKKQADKSDIAKALVVPSTNIKDIAFEEKFSVIKGPFKCPNIDVVIKYKNGNCCAIECKFTEPFRKREERHALQEKYLSGFNGWETIPSIYNFVESLLQVENDFCFLNPSQLVKHILGLLTKYNNDKSKFRLVYLYYDVFGEEGYLHNKEIDEFSSVVSRDGINFKSIIWQELILNMASISIDKHRDYVSYISNRYL